MGDSIPQYPRKSRHFRDESDQLLSYYSSTITTSTRSKSETSPRSTKSKSKSKSPPTRSQSQSETDPLNVLAKTYSYLDGQNGGHNGSGNPVSPLTQSVRSSFFKKKDPSSTPEFSPPKEGDPLISNGVGVPPQHQQPQQYQQQQQQHQQPPTPKKKEKRGGYRVHRVSYTAKNHMEVLFRTQASAFPQVFPFVCANVVWTIWLYYFKTYNIADLTFHSSVGHSFMGLLVSFLVVSRSKISYDRFMNYRRQLAASYQACRELAQYTNIYTFESQTEDAAWWRQEVCFRAILLLRVTMDALLWSSTAREGWEDEYFKFDPEKDGEKEEARVSRHFYRMKQLSHGRRSYVDENFRAPVNFAHILRQVIMEHPHYLGYKLAVNEYRDLLHFVENFIGAFHTFRVLVFTPYPFPLVQMTRAFLFFWVYTLPMVLLKDYRLWSSILIVILVSFGFIGIEYVSIALDDPFGDDTNDVDEHGMSLLVYEDIYLAIYRTDGPEAAMSLRDRVLDRYRQGRELDCYRDDLKGYDVWEMPEWWFQPGQDDGSVSLA